MKRLQNPTLTRPGIATVTVCLAVVAAACLAAAETAKASPTEANAFLRQYCIQCHGETVVSAGIDFTRLISQNSMGESFRQWRKVQTVLEERQMPPEGVPQPSEGERHRASAWIQTELADFAEKHDGDPGKVTVRRLTSSEYAYTVRDLTGLDYNAERDFAGDAVGGEGFTNFGDVQFMADSKIESYLQAAKRIADHAVIGAGPLSFYEDPGMSGFELSAIHRIHDIYRRHGFRAVAAEGGRAFGLEHYGRAFYACWRYQYRQVLGESGVSLDELAAREDMSPRFLEHIWSVVQKLSPSYPTSEVVSRWHDLPEPQGADDDQATVKARRQCEQIQQFVINWPRWLFAAGALAAGGAGDERALVITDASLEPSIAKKLVFSERLEDKETAKIHFSVLPANPLAADRPVVIWRNPMVRIGRADRRREEGRPLRDVLDAENHAKLAFGRSPDGRDVGPDDFVLVADTSLTVNVAVPSDARGLSLDVTVEIDPASMGNAVLRCTVSESEKVPEGSPTWVLLADPQSKGFRSWKANVLEYARNLPQTSHAEPTPSDRDPIPQPLDNAYNQPERDSFHYRVKYSRDDQFLVDKMIDGRTRQQLENAWADLYVSFEYHDAFLNLISNKYELDLNGGSIAELGEGEIEEIPEEPRLYVQALRAEYEAAIATQMAAHPRHIEDTIEFASRAWRRPLSRREKDHLRSFYTTLREDGGLDHRKSIRTLLTRILVAPAFLYRLEQPEEETRATLLSDWELANRLSYFLWSSVPDGELRQAAEAGKLSDPQEIRRQARRMLADPKARRLAAEFFGQWLGFYRFNQHRGVDRSRFPEFTQDVKRAMYEEAVSLFDYVIREDRPLGEIVSADYTFLNQTLAKHYGIEKEIAAGDQVVKLEGADEFRRGGLLRLGAVLTATSAPLRTSPVKRGDWVLRRVLGTPTPLPPADAGSIPADERLFGGLTMREQLDVHRRSPSCVSCHSRIDPLGFPLEHYDAVGRWRTRYSDGEPIDGATTLTDNTRIDGVKGLLDHLQAKHGQTLRTLSTKLLGYALGRAILLPDQPLIDRLVGAGDEATFAELASDIVASRQFRYRRGREDTTPDSAPDRFPAED